jgi:hypothetical protein
MKVFDDDDYNHLPDCSELLPCPMGFSVEVLVVFFYLSSCKTVEVEEISSQIPIFSWGFNLKTPLPSK